MIVYNVLRSLGDKDQRLCGYMQGIRTRLFSTKGFHNGEEKIPFMACLASMMYGRRKKLILVVLQSRTSRKCSLLATLLSLTGYGRYGQHGQPKTERSPPKTVYSRGSKEGSIPNAPLQGFWTRQYVSFFLSTILSYYWGRFDHCGSFHTKL